MSTPERHRPRHEHARRPWTAVLLAAVTILASVSLVGPAASPVAAAGWLTWSAEVVRVLDGDTFEARVNGSSSITVVRVAGLNTHETWTEDPRDPECLSLEAKTRLRNWIEGSTVELRARKASSSSLGRTLRHVFVGSTNVATTMLEEGWGLPLRFQAEPDWALTNAAAAQRARAAGSHIWNPSACGGGPSASVEFVTQYDAAGSDTSNPNGEWVQIRNRGGSSLSLTGWQLRDTGLGRWSFPSGFTLQPNGRVRVHVGRGTNTSSDLYMGYSTSILSNIADGMFLHDPKFNIRAFDMWPCAGNCGLIDPLVIDKVQYDAPGNDITNPNGEWVRIRNIGQSVVDLQDWLIETPPYQMTSVASRPIAPNGTLTIFMGKGSNTSSTMYLGRSSGILSNSGDYVMIRTPHRDLADCAAWGSVKCPAQALGSRLDLTVNWDAAGNDLTNPNGEWVNISNLSGDRIDLSGFKIESPPHSYRFPSGTSVAAGGRLRLRVGRGTNTSTTHYWGKTRGLLDNSGDIVRLLDRAGGVVRSFSYPCPGRCGPVPSPLVIDDVRENAPGNDITNPNGEWIRIRNVSTRPIDLRDWQIFSTPYQLNPTASRVIAPNGTVTIFIGRGTNDSDTLYWQQSSGILTNTGDSVLLLSPHRDVADCDAWGSASCPTVDSISGRLDVTVRYDAAGDDLANPNGEWVNVTNTSPEAIDLTGMLLSTPGHAYTFPAVDLQPNERIRVYVGSGTSSRLRRFWNRSYGIFGNGGDWVALTDARGQEIRAVTWPCSGRCGAIERLRIQSVQYDAPGSDGSNPNGEFVVVVNEGTVPVDLRDWSLETSPHVFDFYLSSTLDPGDTYTVFIGPGSTTTSVGHWGFSSGVLNNTGDSVRLITPHGDVAECERWGSGSC